MRFSISLLLCGMSVFTTVGSWSAAQNSSAPRRTQAPTNVAGAPVRSATGAPISYTEAEASLQAALMPMAPRPAGGVDGSGPTVTPYWAYVAFGNGVGASNIRVADSLGQNEIYLGGSASTFGANNYWYALRYDSVHATYQQVFASVWSSVGIRRLEVGDVVGTSGREIVVAEANGRITLYDQDAKTIEGQFSTLSDLRGLHLADVSGDSKLEVLVVNASTLSVYSGSGQLLWSVAGAGGTDVIAGQMDSDPALEIATTGGTVVDAATHAVQCTWPAGFGFALAVSDFDGDGMQELIASEAWNFCWAYDIDTCLPKWSIPVFNVGAIHVADVDGNGTDELLIGEAQWGAVKAYDPVTQGLLWSINNPEHGTTDVFVADVDHDGIQEVLWGAGATSTGPDRLYVGNWSTQSIEWQNVQLDGPFIGPEKGQVDGDAQEEIVAVSWESDAGYGAGRIVVFDATTLALEGTSQEVLNGLGWTGVHDIKLRDVDNDGRNEILIAGGTTYDGLLEIYDYDGAGGFTRIWNNLVLPGGATFYSVEAADVDNDGALEIIGGTGSEHTGSVGNFVYVYDYASRTEEWHSLQMGSFWSKVSGVHVADLDADGVPEIVGRVQGGDAYVFDGVTKALETIRFGAFTASGTFALGTTGPNYLLLGTASGGLSAVEHVGGSYQSPGTLPLLPGPVSGFTVGPSLSLFVGSQGSSGNQATYRVFYPLAPLQVLFETTGYGGVFGERTVFDLSVPASLTAGSYGLVAHRWQ